VTDNQQSVRRPRVALSTLGCKANQYESGRIAADFAARGFDVTEDASTADVVVINTCTVTNVADGKSRRQIRRLKRENPTALVVATGCAAELEPTKLQSTTGVDLVIPNREKAGLVDRTLSFGSSLRAPLPTLDEDAIPANVAQCRLTSLGRTRAILMIQNGCGYRCSYCIIPTARPVRESRSYDGILEEARQLAADGYREVVLTGISIGSWRDGSRRLHDILRGMAGIEGLDRVRLSSIEPKTVTAPLLDAMATLPNACHHLHIPLQAGDDATLAAMNRYYNTEYFARLMERVRKRLPDVGLSTDVITGFPTETAAQFEETMRFCADMRFCKIHVFPFSLRAGTPAAAMKDSVGGVVRKERTARLMALSDAGAQAWAEASTGSVVDVLAEPRDAATGFYSGLTGNNIRVHWKSDLDVRGQIVPVHLTSARGGEAYGDPL
jgi:threonylcarbamoyladenosine tRNA methylthiotransferase MtaB